MDNRTDNDGQLFWSVTYEKRMADVSIHAPNRRLVATARFDHAGQADAHFDSPEPTVAVLKTRPGNPYLQGALGAAAMACSQNQSTYLGARYRRIAARRGPMKANVAIWHMGRDGTLYDDPGADFFTRLHPERAKNRALHQLEAMGYQVTLGRVG